MKKPRSNTSHLKAESAKDAAFVPTTFHNRLKNVRIPVKEFVFFLEDVSSMRLLPTLVTTGGLSSRGGLTLRPFQLDRIHSPVGKALCRWHRSLVPLNEEPCRDNAKDDQTISEMYHDCWGVGVVF